MSLEERGLVVNWSTLRMAVGQGGDGDSHIKADIDNLAAFVRDPGACVTCLLLPFSGSMELQMQVGLPGHHACRGNQRLSSWAKHNSSGPFQRCRPSLRIGCRGAHMPAEKGCSRPPCLMWWVWWWGQWGACTLWCAVMGTTTGQRKYALTAG